MLAASAKAWATVDLRAADSPTARSMNRSRRPRVTSDQAQWERHTRTGSRRRRHSTENFGHREEVAEIRRMTGSPAW